MEFSYQQLQIANGSLLLAHQGVGSSYLRDYFSYQYFSFIFHLSFLTVPSVEAGKEQIGMIQNYLSGVY